MTQFESAGWQVASQGDFKSAFQALTIVLQQNPGKRQAFAETAYAKGYKDLAYQLNTELKEFDCKAMRTKALTATSTQDMAQQLSATKGMCTSAPTEAEHQAFSAKALAEKDDLVALSLYEQIKSLWGYLDTKSEERMLSYGREIRVYEGNETTVERIRQILPEQLVEDKLARVSIAKEGTWNAMGNHAKCGARTPYLIAPDVVGRVTFSHNDCLYTVVFEDGQRFKSYDEADRARFKKVDWIPRFYVVTEPLEKQPKNLDPAGECRITVEIKSF